MQVELIVEAYAKKQNFLDMVIVNSEFTCKIFN